MKRHNGSRIISSGYYFPNTTVLTKHLIDEIRSKFNDIDSDILEQKMGVSQVRHASHLEKQSDLAINASIQALEKSQVNLSHIDFIIYCGVEGDYVEPSTAHAVQNGLGLKGACFDVSNACLGFTTGMQIADAMISSGTARYILVCTGEKLSTLTKAVLDELGKKPDFESFKRKLGFLAVGDAGGAVLLGPKEGKQGFKLFRAISHGDLANLCYYRMKADWLDGQMVMDKISARAIRAHKDLYYASMQSLKWSPSSVNCLITHQVGKRLFERLSDTFSIGKEKMTKSYDVYGNIATATFPVNYTRALEMGMIKSGDNVFCGMSGSGLAVCQFGLQV